MMAKKNRPSWGSDKNDDPSTPETTDIGFDVNIDESILPIAIDDELSEISSEIHARRPIPGSLELTRLTDRIKEAAANLEDLKSQIQAGRSELEDLKTSRLIELASQQQEISTNKVRLMELEKEITEGEVRTKRVRQAVQESLETARADLERVKLEGLSSMFKWVEQYFEVLPFEDFGKVSGPRTIAVDDLIEFITITDPNGLYITAAEDQGDLVIHLPWISDATTVSRTAATLTLAIVAAVAESKPLSSKLHEFNEARDVSTLIELLNGSAMRSHSDDNNPFTPVRYADLATHTLTALSHAEYDESYADLDSQLILQGLEQSTTEWMNIVLPQFTNHTIEHQSVFTNSQLDDLPFEVVSDWLADGELPVDGTDSRYSELISKLSAMIDSEWANHFEQPAISALKYWINGLRPSISRADDLSVGASLTLDLTLRLGNGSMPVKG